MYLCSFVQTLAYNGRKTWAFRLNLQVCDIMRFILPLVVCLIDKTQEQTPDTSHQTFKLKANRRTLNEEGRDRQNLFSPTPLNFSFKDYDEV